MGSPKEGQEQMNQAAEAGGGRHLDSEFLEKSHDRLYNPIDEAKKGTVSETINADAGKQRYGKHQI